MDDYTRKQWLFSVQCLKQSVNRLIRLSEPDKSLPYDVGVAIEKEMGRIFKLLDDNERGEKCQ